MVSRLLTSTARFMPSGGETDKALDALGYAWDIGDAGVVLLNMDGLVNPLRDQPRFKALMEKWQDPAKR